MKRHNDTEDTIVLIALALFLKLFGMAVAGLVVMGLWNNFNPSHPINFFLAVGIVWVVAVVISLLRGGK